MNNLEKIFIGFGTALTRKLALEDMPRVLIISETTYEVVCVIYDDAMWQRNCDSNR